MEQKWIEVMWKDTDIERKTKEGNYAREKERRGTKGKRSGRQREEMKRREEGKGQEARLMDGRNKMMKKSIYKNKSVV